MQFEAKSKAWSEWIEWRRTHADVTTEEAWGMGFDACRSTREIPDLQPVIDWLENGCDPIEAAKELRICQARRDAR